MTTTPTAQYASFWRRFGAAFIDGILVIIVVYILTSVIGYIIRFSLGGEIEEATATVIAIINVLSVWLVVTWIYYAAMESSSKQATLGKMALGIIVTDLEGRRISFGRATGRHFGKIISLILCNIGFIPLNTPTMIVFTEKKQALHDRMAGCLVVVASAIPPILRLAPLPY